MTVDTVELIALLDSDPAAGILAIADLREQRAKRVASGPWLARPAGSTGRPTVWDINGYLVSETPGSPYAEHIAAEANPAHALAAVRRWRGVVERHYMEPGMFPPQCGACKPMSTFDELDGAETVWVPIWPCDDLRETADEARAYLGGAA